MYDLRWDGIAQDWLRDCGLPDDLVTRYAPRLAQQLHDMAEEAPDEIAGLERERDAAAYDAHIHRQIDEARGK